MNKIQAAEARGYQKAIDALRAEAAQSLDRITEAGADSAMWDVYDSAADWLETVREDQEPRVTDKIEKLANDEIAVIVWPYGAGQKQIGLCFDDEENPSAIFALPTERAFLVREAIFGTALRAEVASLRQQLAAARLHYGEALTDRVEVQGKLRAAEADRDLLFSELAEARRELRDGLSDRDLLMDVPPDQLVDEVLALIDRGYQQYTELRSSYVDLFANESRLLDVYRAAEAWAGVIRLLDWIQGDEDDRLSQPSRDLLGAVDSYRSATPAQPAAAWIPAKDGDTPGQRDIEDDPPQPIRADAPAEAPDGERA